jgi:hypothetical protein
MLHDHVHEPLNQTVYAVKTGHSRTRGLEVKVGSLLEIYDRNYRDREMDSSKPICGAL